MDQAMVSFTIVFKVESALHLLDLNLVFIFDGSPSFDFMLVAAFCLLDLNWVSVFYRSPSFDFMLAAIVMI